MSDWETSVCETNGINIHYTRTGGSKPPLVLLHGLTANGACWMSLARALEQEYDIIMPDARGHGESSAPDSGYGYDDHANDVIGLINSLRLPPVVLAGHSMGGMTAAVAASRRPSLLRGLILADPTFLSAKVQREVYASDVKQRHQLILTKSLEELTANLRKGHSNRPAETIELLARARLKTSMAAFDVLTPPNPDYKQLMSAIDIPSLLVFAEKGVVSAETAEELQQLNPKLQVVRIPDLGHGLHYDQPERIAAIFGSFLRSI